MDNNRMIPIEIVEKLLQEQAERLTRGFNERRDR